MRRTKGNPKSNHLHTMNIFKPDNSKLFFLFFCLNLFMSTNKYFIIYSKQKFYDRLARQVTNI